MSNLKHVLSEEYMRLGWLVVPIPPRDGKPTKAPPTGWDQIGNLLKPGTAASVLGPNWNVGLLLRDYADVDLDCREARSAGAIFLPPTSLVYGRASARRSHWLFKPSGPLAYKKFVLPGDTERGDLMELRIMQPPNGEASRAFQSLLPGSIHPDSGELYEWDSFEPALAECESPALWRGAHLAAITSALARLHPALDEEHKTHRDEFRLAISGMLARYLPAEGDKVFFAALHIAGDQKDRQSIYMATVAKLNAGDDRIPGIPSFARIVGDKVANRVVSWIEEISEKKAGPYVVEEEPKPQKPEVAEEVRWPDPPEEEAFYGLAGEIANTIFPHTEASKVALLVQTLVCFGNVIGRSAYFTAEASQHHFNLFAVLVGVTSRGRKGSSLAQVLRIFAPVDTSWFTNCMQSGLSSGEGLIYAVRDPVRKMVRQRGGGYEEEETDAGVTDKRLLVFESEFSSPLRLMARDGNILSVVLRQGWDGSTLRTLTKNSPMRATGAHVSIVGHITKDELRREITATDQANGFANRFLWTCTARSKKLPEGGNLAPQDIAALVDKVRRAAAFAGSVGEMKRDPSIKHEWAELYDHLGAEDSGMQADITARAEPQIMRIACLQALFNHSAVVRSEHLQASAALWEYFDSSTKFIFGTSLGDPTADTILAALKNAPGGLTRTEISELFEKHKSAAELARALGVLRERGLAYPVREATADNVRPTETWFMVGSQQK